MKFLYFALFAGGIVAADQVTKFLTVANIGLWEDIPFIPGLLQLTYVQNTGAAFSSFEGQQWLFALIFVVFTCLIFWEYFRKPMGFSTFHEREVLVTSLRRSDLTCHSITCLECMLLYLVLGNVDVVR